MKLFDIGATVAAATRSLVATVAPDFLTVHGDPHVVAAAAEAAAPRRPGSSPITILTSLDRADLDAALIRDGTLSDIVLERARRAFAAGADGVVASPQEAAAFAPFPRPPALIVTPGIRPAGSAPGDQKRIATPAEALAAGADHLVVARPICAAPDPRAAARAILAEMAPVGPKSEGEDRTSVLPTFTGICRGWKVAGKWLESGLPLFNRGLIVNAGA